MWSRSNLLWVASSAPSGMSFSIADSYVTATVSGGLRGHEVQSARDVRLHVFAVDHGVKHAVLQEELAALKTFRQLLADGLLDHARSGETDQRARLCDVQIAQHGVRGGHAARGGTSAN